MKLVLDSNIVFSALLSPKNRSRLILFNSDFELYSCHFLFVELFKHKEKLQKFSRLNDEELLTALQLVLNRIRFVSADLIPKETFRQALAYCGSVDEKDTPFVALSLFLKAHLLTGDQRLVAGLRKKGFEEVRLLKDLG